jgi:hypothetical protein
VEVCARRACLARMRRVVARVTVNVMKKAKSTHAA